MPRRPQKRVNSAVPSCKANPSQPDGDEVKFFNSSDLRTVNKRRRLEGKPPINIEEIIKVFADYLEENDTDLEPFGFTNFSKWVEAMIEDVRRDKVNTWVFAVEKGKAVAYACGEVMRYTVPTTRLTSKDNHKTFLYIANVCSVKPGCGSEAMKQLIEQQILNMRCNGAKGDITVMLNFTPGKKFLAAYYSKLGFKLLSKLSSPKECHCAKVIKDPVHSVVMYKTFREV
jgi:hypothetical protein